MSHTLVITSSWWLHAEPKAPWRLIADAAAWPRWWRSMRQVRVVETLPQAVDEPSLWPCSPATGLNLQVRQHAADPQQFIEWQVAGDLQATWTWSVLPVTPTGCDVTCRCELKSPTNLPLWWHDLSCALLERRQLARARACARDMGHALDCRVARLREWSGRSR